MNGNGSPVRRTHRLLAAVAVTVAAVVIVSCSEDAANELTGPAAAGADLATSYNCTSCHTVDGTRSTGPTWKGIWGEQVLLADGNSVEVDDAYVRRSITDPPAQVVDGFSPIMPAFDLPDNELEALTAYIRSLDEDR